MHCRSLLIALALSVAILPACGGGDSSSSPPCPPQADARDAQNGAVTVCAFDPFKFDVKTIKTPAGEVEITLINKGAQPHTLAIKDGPSFEVKTPKRNDVDTGKVTLTAGQYDFECTIPGHAAGGMKGVIDVS
jgi:plastocyanin